MLANEENTEAARNSLKSIEFQDYNKVPQTLEEINQVLEKFGFVVIMIDLQSDFYSITVINLDSYPDVLESANIWTKKGLSAFQTN